MPGQATCHNPLISSRVIAATIDAMSELDVSQRETGAWWVVTLHLRDTPLNAEVRLPQRTGGLGRSRYGSDREVVDDDPEP